MDGVKSISKTISDASDKIKDTVSSAMNKETKEKEKREIGHLHYTGK